jgi:hypothetical protein
MRSMSVAGIVALLVVTPRSEADAVTAFNANVYQWSSSTASNPAMGIYPIGGSGAINGGFVVSTGSDGAQIGMRASLRTIGLLRQANDGVTATYFAPTGTSGGNLALWNFDMDIDLTHTNHTLSDYSATAIFTDRSGLVTPLNLLAAGTPGNLVLGQSSENAGFSFLAPVFPSFDPSAKGVYSFELTLVPQTFSGDTLDVKMNVSVAAVPEPAGITLALAGAVGLCLRSRRRRATA